MKQRRGYKGLKKKKTGKPAGISDKIIRILDIYMSIARNSYPSVNDLADRYGVHKRTIHRDIQIINSIDSVIFDKEKDGYRFVHGDRIKKLRLSDDDMLLLIALGEAASHLGPPFQENFQNFMARMTAVTEEIPDGRSNIMIKIPGAIQSEKMEEYFHTISACINDRRSIDIVYYTLKTGKTTERRVDPYGLVYHNGVWILIGYCHRRKEVRNFALDCIMDLKEKWLYFNPPRGFSLDDYLSRSWGIYTQPTTEVVVRFSRYAARWIKRKEKWHPSEKRRVLPGGGIELTFRVAGTEEIKQWLYKWIPHIEIIKPRRLRKKVQKELAATAERHAD